LPPPSQEVATQPQGRSPVNRFLVAGIGALVVLALGVVGIVWALGGGNETEATKEPQQKPAEKQQGAQAVTEQQPEQSKPSEQQAAAEPQPGQPKPITLSGTQTSASKFFQLKSGLVVFKMTHQGKGPFWVDMLDDQGKQLGSSLTIKNGAVSVSTARHISREGRYILDVQADGPWNITIEQPRLTSAPQKRSFSGEKEAATSLFELSSGLKRISMTHKGRGGNFIVELLDEQGREMGFSLANEIGPTNTATAVTIPHDGIYLFRVEATGPWTIRIEE
jgi:hypothetical protein